MTEPCFTSEGENKTLRTKAYDFYVHIREAWIVPYQNSTALNVTTTYDLNQNPVELHIAPFIDSSKGVAIAFGTYKNDDGETRIGENYHKAQFGLEFKKIGSNQFMFKIYNDQMACSRADFDSKVNKFSELVLHNAKNSGFENNSYNALYNFRNGTSSPFNNGLVTYSAEEQVLRVKNLGDYDFCDIESVIVN